VNRTNLAAAETGLEDVQSGNPDAEGDLSTSLGEHLGDSPAKPLRESERVPSSCEFFFFFKVGIRRQQSRRLGGDAQNPPPLTWSSATPAMKAFLPESITQQVAMSGCRLPKRVDRALGRSSSPRRSMLSPEARTTTVEARRAECGASKRRTVMRRAEAPGATANGCLLASMLRGEAKGALPEALALLVAAPRAARAEADAEVIAAILECLFDQIEAKRDPSVIGWIKSNRLSPRIDRSFQQRDSETPTELIKVLKRRNSS
jgi:hypothetical protein